MKASRIATLSLLSGLLLTGFLYPSAALACSVPVGFDPKCPTGESFNTISCQCAAVQESRVAPALRPRTAEEQALADEAHRKAENRITPPIATSTGPLPSAMTSCATSADCQVINGVCGNPLAVNRAAESDAAKIIADINRRVECARGDPAVTPATGACLQNHCKVVRPVMQQ